MKTKKSNGKTKENKEKLDVAKLFVVTSITLVMTMVFVMTKRLFVVTNVKFEICMASDMSR